MCENAVYRLVLSRCAIFTVYSVVPYGKGGRRYYSGLNLNQDKATKPQTVQIVRQGKARQRRTGLKLIHYISQY